MGAVRWVLLQTWHVFGCGCGVCFKCVKRQNGGLRLGGRCGKVIQEYFLSPNLR